MTNDEAKAKLVDLLGGSGNPIVRVLRCTELAEEAIEEAGIDRSNSEAFRWLCPSPVLVPLHENLYRSFARELLIRYKGGAKPSAMRKITNAEILATLSQTSLVAPLTRSGYALYHRLFTEIMGPLDDVPEPSEAWAGQWTKNSNG